MANSPLNPRRAIPLGVRETALVLGSAVGIFVAVAGGSAISSYAPEGSPVLLMLSFAAPAAAVFGVFWLIARRLRP
jgi:uncharacterized membrane protein YdjX (TVP38/TMEM64 family)